MTGRGTKTPISVELIKEQNIYFLKATSLKSEALSFHTFKTKNKAKDLIASLYNSFLNSNPQSLDFLEVRDNFINTFGLNLYNSLLEQSYTKFIPSAKDFLIELKGRTYNEKCFIKVNDYKIIDIRFRTKPDEEEIISISNYADTHKILYKFILKNKLKITKL